MRPSDSTECVQVAVLGSGAFGTAMATIAARKGHTVTMYARNEQQVYIYIQLNNLRYR